MTKPQLTNLTNFNSTANTVASETINTDANLFNFSLPFIDIDSGIGGLPGAINITFRGKSRSITLTGQFNGTEAELVTFVEEIENEVKDSSQSKKTYTNSIAKTYAVRLNNFTYVTTLNTNRVEYTLELLTETA